MNMPLCPTHQRAIIRMHPEGPVWEAIQSSVAGTLSLELKGSHPDAPRHYCLTAPDHGCIPGSASEAEVLQTNGLWITRLKIETHPPVVTEEEDMLRES